ncbi:hypothetical protein POG22_11370 [Geitlerinema sp. CS-897]|nr:hypothetical protein [Geitlerinema sp. CS-897]
MDELDRHLKHLAEIAKQHPPGSKGRIIATTRLLMAIEQSGKLYCQGRHDYPPEVYHDAMQAVRVYVFRLIDRYEPSAAKMMTLVNQKLNHEFKDAIKKLKKERPQHLSLSQAIDRGDKDSQQTLEDVLSGEEQENPYLSDRIFNIIKNDIDNAFKDKHIRNKPEANFQKIALHILEHRKMRELAQAWDIPEQTLYSFFRRSCESFRSLFGKYIKDN